MMERTLGRAGTNSSAPGFARWRGETMSDLAPWTPAAADSDGATVVNLGYKLSSALVQTACSTR